MNHFWTNTIWFILLGITSIIEITYVLIKSKKRLLIFAMYITIAGIVFMFELTVFGFLKSYDYYPMIFNHISRLDDGLAGNIFSQFSVSATAILISFLNLKYYWYLIVPLIYGGIEELFLSLGIYTHNWYRTWMTVAGLIILFIISKIIYNKTLKGPGALLRYVNIFFAVYVPHTIIVTWPFKLLGYPAFNEHVVPDPTNSIFLLFGANFIMLSSIIMVVYFMKLKWWWHAIAILTIYAIYYIASIFNYIIMKGGVFLTFTTIEILGMYLSVFAIDRLYETG